MDRPAIFVTNWGRDAYYVTMASDGGYHVKHDEDGYVASAPDAASALRIARLCAEEDRRCKDEGSPRFRWDIRPAGCVVPD